MAASLVAAAAPAVPAPAKAMELPAKAMELAVVGSDSTQPAEMGVAGGAAPRLASGPTRSH